MKKTVGVFVLAALLMACSDEEGGTMHFQMRYTNTPEVSQSKTISENYYTGFGDYITSLTPSVFIGRFGMLGFQDDYNNMDQNTHMLLFIEGNISDDDPIKIADFSNNAVVSYSPNLGGIQDDHGLFVNEKIDFTYFYFDLLSFYQEVNLPPQYENVNIEMFNGMYANREYLSDLVKVNNVLRIEHFPFIYNIFNTFNGWPSAYVFGNCDSTFVFNTEGNIVPNSTNWPFGGSTILQIIRSNKYYPVTINTPGEGETVDMIATLSFDTNNLIQIYAGADNIPYNSDDVFIYSPNYWERIMVKLIIE